jgi:hypothetical protein
MNFGVIATPTGRTGTGAKLRRCAGQAPVLAQRRQVQRRRVALVAVEAVGGQRSCSAAHRRSRCTLARIDAAEIAGHLGVALHDAPRRHGSTGSRLPSTSTGAASGAGPPRRAHRQQRGLQDVQAVDLLDAGLGDAQHRALARISSNRRSRRAASAPSSRPGRGSALQVVQDHRRRHHRPGQRPAAGLVDAGHQAGRRPAEPELFRRRSTCAIASVAARAVSRQEFGCSR